MVVAGLDILKHVSHFLPHATANVNRPPQVFRDAINLPHALEHRRHTGIVQSLIVQAGSVVSRSYTGLIVKLFGFAIEHFILWFQPGVRFNR